MQVIGLLSSLVVGHTTGPVPWVGLLAHQGGWDEILMVLVPVSVFAALLYVANRRASSLAEREGSSGGGESTGADPGPDGTPPARKVPRNDRGGPI